mgnify:CR=1 FL=1
MKTKRRSVKVDLDLLSRLREDGERRFLAALAMTRGDDRRADLSHAGGFLAGIAAAYLACGDKETFEAIYTWMQTHRDHGNSNPTPGFARAPATSGSAVT